MFGKGIVRSILIVVAVGVLTSRPARATDGIGNECCVCHDCGELSVVCISPTSDTAPGGAAPIDMVNCNAFCPKDCASSEVAPSACSALGSACIARSPAPVASRSGLTAVAVVLAVSGAYVSRRRRLE